MNREYLAANFFTSFILRFKFFLNGTSDKTTVILFQLYNLGSANRVTSCDCHRHIFLK